MEGLTACRFKTRNSDPWFSWLVKEQGTLGLLLTEIVSSSFGVRLLFLSLKHTIVQPALKKPTLNSRNVSREGRWGINDLE